MRLRCLYQRWKLIERSRSLFGWLRLGSRCALANERSGSRHASGFPWWTSGVFLAFGIGFGLTILDQVVGPLLSQQTKAAYADSGWWQLLTGALVVGSGYATIALAVGLLASVRQGALRVVGAVVVGAVMGVLFALHVFGLTTRVLSGSFLTVGTIEFVLACGRGPVVGVLRDFAGAIVGLGCGALAVAVGASWFLLRRRSAPKNAHAGFRVVLSSIAVIPALLYGSGTLATPETSLVRALSQSSSELAFLASLEAADGAREGSQPDALGYPVPDGQGVRSGPPQKTGEDWKAALRDTASLARPNVLLIVLESVPSSHVGYLGYHRPTTPHLDALARRSVRMRRVWSTATHSNYAQMAILSSLFPRRGHGLDVYDKLDYPRVLQHDVFFWLGYRTATFSSQDEDWQGMRRFQATGSPTTFWHSDDYPGLHVLTSSERVVPDAVTVDRAIEWMDGLGAGRWSVYLNLQATHFPYRLPPGAKSSFQPTGPLKGPYQYFNYQLRDRAMVVNRYDNALRYVDEQLGRLAKYLEQSGQLERTLWVITADHGELFADRGVVTHGRTLREGELRVPLLLHWPGKLVPGDVDEPVSHLDVLPTILELLGVRPHPAFQGTSFASLRRHREFGRGIFFNIQGQRLAEGVLCWPWKLVTVQSSQKTSLFDLGADPDARTDLSTERPLVVARLMRFLREHVEAQVGYHQNAGDQRQALYVPRLQRCPELPPGTAGRTVPSSREFWLREVGANGHGEGRDNASEELMD